MGTATSGSNEIRAASDDLARRTEEQAASLEETAAAISKINSAVQETASTSTDAHRTLQETVHKARDGSQIVTQAVAAMQEIERSSEKINHVISVIESISFQTNLLALNAGVEAARAGESGKGFAVVANEVRALAQRCADAAEEVQELVTSSSLNVENGVDLVNRTGAAFAAIIGDIDALSSAVQSIATSSSLQAQSLSQINGAVGDLDRSTQQNAAMAEQCTAAATSLAREASSIEAEVAYFNVGGGVNGQITDYSFHLAA
jgi:methyl-accepting chemotaxis protein